MLKVVRPEARLQKKEPVKKKKLVSDGFLFDFAVGSFAVIACALLFVGSLLLFSFRRKPFCSQTMQHNCVKCPPNAVCDGDRLVCLKGFERIRGVCVETGNLSKVIGKSIAAVRESLNSRAGAYVCGSGERDWMGRDQVELIVLKESGEDFPVALAKTLEFLESDENVEVRPFGETVLYISRNPRKSVICVLGEVFQKVVMFVCVMLVVFARVLYVRERKRKVKGLDSACFPLFRAVFEVIRQRRGNEVSESQLKLKLETMTKDVEKIWPVIEARLEKSPMIMTRMLDSEKYYRICS